MTIKFKLILFAEKFCSDDLQDIYPANYCDQEDKEDSIKVYPNGRILIKISMAKYKLEANKVFTAFILPCFDLTLKHGITILNQIVVLNSQDDYIDIILYNAGHQPYAIKKGDKIAEMLVF